MELFFPFSVIRSKNFLYKSFPIWSTASKLVFKKRNWNYLNRKWNYISPFQLSDQNVSFAKITPFPNVFLRNRKWNYLSRKSNYLYHFQSSDQKLILQKFHHLVRWFQNDIWKTGNGILQKFPHLIFCF